MKMRHIHPSAWCAAFVGAVGLLSYSLPGWSQAPVKNAELYTGDTADVAGVKLGGWGSGLAKEDPAFKTVGETSIRVETNGYYSGGRIEFEEPRDVTAQKSDPYAFLAFIIRFQPGTKRQGPAAGPSGYPGAFSGGSGYPGAGEGGGFPGGGFPGGYPGGGSPGEQQIVPDTAKMKVVLKCEEGTFVASNFPVTLNPASEEGWFSVAIPFVAFKGLEAAQTAKIKEIRVFGDTRDTFWIGEIRTTTDEEPINVEPLEDAEVSIGEAVEFRASATGGISPLQYSWDFDLSDGIQEDALGPAVVHVFRKPSREVPGVPGEVQPFVITLTVKDLSGAKRQVRRTANVIVNP